MLKRIHELEEELAGLRSQLVPSGGNRLTAFFRGFFRFLLSSWTLLTFAVAVATALYVKYAYEIDYFEQYREQSTKKKLSELHRQLGDRMLGRSEWEAADNAYKEALKINPNNAAAANGLVKSQVFLPLGKEKSVAREVIDIKLQYLDEIFPGDYVVDFLKGVRFHDMLDNKAALQAFERSAQKNPDFTGAFLMIGYIRQQQFDLEAAIKNYLRAAELDPQNPTAHNNLGFMYLLSGKYKDAATHLLRSDMLAPAMLNGINLGDAFRYTGDLERATRVHTTVLRNARRPGIEDDRYLGGEWTYNFMPLAPDDVPTMRRYINAFTLEQKLAIAYFALALDHALGGNTEAANGALNEALKLEDGAGYRNFYDNKIAFVQTLPKRSDSANALLRTLSQKVSAK